MLNLSDEFHVNIAFGFGLIARSVYDEFDKNFTNSIKN